MIKKITFLTGSMLASFASFAANDNIQSVIDAFTNCDNSFFYQLKANAADFEGIADLTIKDDIAYIPVADITSEKDRTYYFSQPIQYRGLSISAYQNIYIQTPFLGQYYYWGFIIDDSIENVKNRLPQLKWQQHSVASYVANPKLYDRAVKNKGWQNNPYTIDDVMPRSFTVEKLLYLEPISENQVHLVCSIQGDIDNDLLHATRPDIKYINAEIAEKRAEEIDTQKEQTPQQQESMELESNNDEQTNEGA